MRIHPQVLQLGADFEEYYHVKVHFIEAERTAIIDTGLAEHPLSDFEPYLKEYGKSLSQVRAIFNTHGHNDHAAGNPAIKALSHAEAYMHAADVPIVEKPGWIVETYKANWWRLMGTSEEKIATALTAARARPPGAHKIEHPLKDNERVQLGRGVTLRAVPMPGHTRGSVGFFWEEEGWLFAGDSLQGQGADAGELPIVYHPELYGKMLEEIKLLPIRKLVLSHFVQALSVSNNNIKKGTEIMKFLNDCSEVHNRICDCVSRATFSHWGEPFPRILSASLDLLQSRLNLWINPATGYPLPFGHETIAGYYLAFGGKNVPA
jgi:glyoxylase-like metal-dependent hydrolase (beta-lactamase superfamily II)